MDSDEGRLREAHAGGDVTTMQRSGRSQVRPVPARLPLARPGRPPWRSAVLAAGLALLGGTAVPAGAAPPPAEHGLRQVAVAPAEPAPSAGEEVPGAVVVQTEGPAGAAVRTAIAEAAVGAPGQVVAPDTFVVHLPAETDPEVLGGVDGVVALHPELVYRAADTEPGDTCWRSSDCVDERGRPAVGGQVELRSVGAPQAWDRSRGSADVVVAVLDTRIETEPPHRDLVGKLLPGASFVADPTCRGPATARGHGTIAAGLIAARTDNGTDVAGLGWDTRVLPVEVLDDCGAGTTSGVAAGVRWAADAGADILNLSLTGGGRDPALSSAVAYARSKGVLVVAAAGNQGGTNEVFPAADLGVVAVAATGVPGSPGGDRIAPFSNRGPWVDVAAPGTEVVGLRRGGGSTTAQDGTTRATGTSFAAPLVAATAALVMAQDPALTTEQVVARLAQTAAPVPGTGEHFLWGRLDAAAALGPLPVGYRLAAADGGLFSFGDAPFAGSAVGAGVVPVIDAAHHVSGRGYWLARADGRVEAFGSAPPVPAPAAERGAAPVVGIAATNGGDGHWTVTSTGRVAASGKAPPLGSADVALRRPIVDLAASPRGDGYWLVAGDGGVFSFGSAAFHGSTGATRLNQPIVGMAATPSGAGYWLLARDGGIFSFGDADFFGSTGSMPLNQPVVGMSPTPSGQGYWLVAADGGIFAFGDAAFLGSLGGVRLNQPIVAMTGR